jgi:hypothetical protein
MRDVYQKQQPSQESTVTASSTIKAQGTKDREAEPADKLEWLVTPIVLLETVCEVGPGIQMQTSWDMLSNSMLNCAVACPRRRITKQVGKPLQGQSIQN